MLTIDKLTPFIIKDELVETNEKDRNRKYSVYYHQNKINGKFYIGMTGQKPESRWSNGNGYVKCTKFWNAIQKYGWDNFEHVVVASGLDQQEAEQFEMLLIEKCDSTNEKFGYNICVGGYNNRHIPKPVYQYDTYGRFICKWDSTADAEAGTGISKSVIWNGCTKNEQHYASGYLWTYDYQPCLPAYIKKQPSRRKAVLQIDFDLNIVQRYDSPMDVDPNIYSSSMVQQCANKKWFTHKNSYWCYEKDYDPDSFRKYVETKLKQTEENKFHYPRKQVAQYDSTGNLLAIYKNPTEATKATGANISTVYGICNGNITNSKKYYFKYVEEDCVPKEVYE